MLPAHGIKSVVSVTQMGRSIEISRYTSQANIARAGTANYNCGLGCDGKGLTLYPAIGADEL